MRVLGVDPGSIATGYGVVERSRERGRSRGKPGVLDCRLVECGVLRSARHLPLPERLRELHQSISELIARHAPDVVAVESLFYGRNARSVLALGQARGVVLLAAAQADREVLELPPTEIKKAVTGTGAATKEQVQYMLSQLLRLRQAPRPADAADGVATALACLLGSHMRLVRARGPLTTARHDSNGRSIPGR